MGNLLLRVAPYVSLVLVVNSSHFLSQQIKFSVSPKKKKKDQMKFSILKNLFEESEPYKINIKNLCLCHI